MIFRQIGCKLFKRYESFCFDDPNLICVLLLRWKPLDTLLSRQKPGPERMNVGWILFIFKRFFRLWFF